MHDQPANRSLASVAAALEGEPAEPATTHRGARSLITFTSGLFYTVITVLLGFVATPLLVRWLGDTRFGAYRAAVDWFGHFSLLDFGLGGALMPLLAMTMARQPRRLLLVLRTAIYAYARITLFILLAGVPLILFLPHLVRVAPAMRADLITGGFIGLAGFLLLPLTPLAKWLETAQTGYWINFALLAQSLLTVGLALGLARLGWGITGQFVALSAGLLLVSLVYLWRARHRLSGGWRALLGRPDAAILGQLRRLQWPAWVLTLSGRLQFFTDNILVAGLISPAAVVPFLITQKLPALGLREAQRVSAASWPALAEMHARGELPLFRRRLFDLTRMTSVLGCLLMLPVVIFNREFVIAWMGTRYYAGLGLTFFAALNAVLQSNLTVWQYCIDGTGQMRRIAPMSALQAGFNLAASLLLTWRLGLLGPVLGTTLAFLGFGVWYLPLTLWRCFQVSPRRLWFNMLMPAGWAVVVGWAGWQWARWRPPAGIVATLAQMAGVAAVYGLFAWLFIFSRQMRREQSRWLRSSLRMLRG